jgi:hypothetical protein
MSLLRLSAGSGLLLDEFLGLLFMYAKAKKITSGAVNAELGVD